MHSNTSLPRFLKKSLFNFFKKKHFSLISDIIRWQITLAWLENVFVQSMAVTKSTNQKKTTKLSNFSEVTNFSSVHWCFSALVSMYENLIYCLWPRWNLGCSGGAAVR